MFLFFTCLKYSSYFFPLLLVSSLDGFNGDGNFIHLMKKKDPTTFFQLDRNSKLLFSSHSLNYTAIYFKNQLTVLHLSTEASGIKLIVVVSAATAVATTVQNFLSWPVLLNGLRNAPRNGLRNGLRSGLHNGL